MKKDRDGYWKWFAGNLASGGAAGASSLLFVYSLDYARTRLANDSKSSKKGGGERQFNGLFDVYRKTLASDGIAGLYRGFVISCVGIVVYRGLYFGMYDSLKPVLLVGTLEVRKYIAFQDPSEFYSPARVSCCTCPASKIFRSAVVLCCHLFSDQISCFLRLTAMKLLLLPFCILYVTRVCKNISHIQV